MEGDERSALHPSTAPNSPPAAICLRKRVGVLRQVINTQPLKCLLVLLDAHGSTMVVLLLSSLSLLWGFLGVGLGFFFDKTSLTILNTSSFQ